VESAEEDAGAKRKTLVTELAGVHRVDVHGDEGAPPAVDFVPPHGLGGGFPRGVLLEAAAGVRQKLGEGATGAVWRFRSGEGDIETLRCVCL